MKNDHISIQYSQKKKKKWWGPDKQLISAAPLSSLSSPSATVVPLRLTSRPLLTFLFPLLSFLPHSFSIYLYQSLYPFLSLSLYPSFSFIFEIFLNRKFPHLTHSVCVFLSLGVEILRVEIGNFSFFFFLTIGFLDLLPCVSESFSSYFRSVSSYSETQQRGIKPNPTQIIGA